MKYPRRLALRLICSMLAALSVGTVPAAEMKEHPADAAAATAEVVCVPAAQRGDRELGCFVLASKEFGKLPDTALYWHLYVYPNRAAAEAVQGDVGTVVTPPNTWQRLSCPA
jgi:hypothetical protein